LAQHPRVVSYGTDVAYLDLNMAILECGYKGVSDYWSIDPNNWTEEQFNILQQHKVNSVPGYTAVKFDAKRKQQTLDERKADWKKVCDQYKTSTEKAIAYMKNFAGWRVLRSHESLYNIEGDNKTHIDNLLPQLLDAGIRVALVSHFHAGAIMVKTKTTETEAQQITRAAGLKDLTSVVWNGTAYAKQTTNTVTIPPLQLNAKDKSIPDFVQIVVGHSGRFLDPLCNELKDKDNKIIKVCKDTSAIIYWGRGRMAEDSKNKNAYLDGDKFGFAHVIFNKDSINVNFYNNKDAAAEMSATLTLPKSKTRKLKK